MTLSTLANLRELNSGLTRDRCAASCSDPETNLHGVQHMNSPIAVANSRLTYILDPLFEGSLSGATRLVAVGERIDEEHAAGSPDRHILSLCVVEHGIRCVRDVRALVRNREKASSWGTRAWNWLTAIGMISEPSSGRSKASKARLSCCRLSGPPRPITKKPRA